MAKVRGNFQTSHQLLTLLLGITWIITTVDALKLYKSRADALSLLLDKDGKEQELYFSRCVQSSRTATCIFAMDEGSSQEPSQCSMTELQPEPYWRGILETPSYISQVTLLNIEPTHRSFEDALTNMTLLVNDLVCGKSTSLENFVKRTFSCDTVGDEVVIRSQHDNAVLALCDVEVMGVPLKFPGVLGANKPLHIENCEQSSLKGDCRDAFDNNTNTCAATLNDEPPWIELVLWTPSILNEIRIHSLELKSFTVTLDGRTCDEYYESSPIDSKRMLGCKYFGSKIRITGEKGTALSSLCEVQAFGYEAASLSDPVNYRSLGCREDTNKEVRLGSRDSCTRMSHNKCYQVCKRKNSRNFALLAGSFCFCGDKFEAFTAVDDGKCKMHCDDDTQLEFCGGPVFIYNVFEIFG